MSSLPDIEPDTTTVPRCRQQLPWPSEWDMRDLGYSQAEIDGLRRVGVGYPHREYTESDAQWQRLCFTAWRFRSRRVDRVDGAA